MKIFEQRQQDGSRKLMGTMTTVDNAVEVDLKTQDGTTSKFNFSGQYHYVAPGSFAVNGTDTPLGMYIGEDRVVPPASIDFKATVEDFELTPATKTAYTVGDKLDLTGIEVKLVYSNGVKKVTTSYTTVPENGATITAEMDKVTVSVTGVTGTKSFNLTVTVPNNNDSQPEGN